MDRELQENIAYYMSGQKEKVEEPIDLGVPLGACLMLTCKGCNKIGEVGCISYRDVLALMWHRHDDYCPQNAPIKEVKKAKVNPLKASKRN